MAGCCEATRLTTQSDLCRNGILSVKMSSDDPDDVSAWISKRGMCVEKYQQSLIIFRRIQRNAEMGQRAFAGMPRQSKAIGVAVKVWSDMLAVIEIGRDFRDIE